MYRDGLPGPYVWHYGLLPVHCGTAVPVLYLGNIYDATTGMATYAALHMNMLGAAVA